MKRADLIELTAEAQQDLRISLADPIAVVSRWEGEVLMEAESFDIRIGFRVARWKKEGAENGVRQS